MPSRATPWAIGLGAVMLLCLTSLFQVRENQVAIRSQWGEIQGSNYGPGLHMQWPFIDKVVKFEKRIISQNYQGETFLTSENKGLIVDFYVKWRIDDVAHYYRTSGGNEQAASSRLGEIVKDGIKSVVAKRTLQEIVIAERAAFTTDMFGPTSEAVREMGIELIDVRVQRIDLPDEVSGSVYQRMQESFRALANRLRAEGSSEAERIRAEADRKRTEVLATAQRDAQRIRAEGDASAARIYSAAYSKSPEFYAFFRTLESYSTMGPNTTLMLGADAEFFRYLESTRRRPAGGR